MYKKMRADNFLSAQKNKEIIFYLLNKKQADIFLSFLKKWAPINFLSVSKKRKRADIF